MNILAIESSCDDTSVAVVADGRKVLSCVTASQIDTHKIYGGVVPEIASRQHTEVITALAKKAVEDAELTFQDIHAVAATAFPGLIGSLLVGLNFAKGLSYALGVPLVPVHHIMGHIAANYIAFPELEPPFLCLVVSGGHSILAQVSDYTSLTVLGTTRDDAAGEAFDKVGRLLGLPYPGGVQIDRLTPEGDPEAYRFPKANVSGAPLDFSFSGMKTAALNQIHNGAQKGQPVAVADFAASFAHALCGELSSRLEIAIQETGAKKVALAGGVAANSTLRNKVQALCQEMGVSCSIPPLHLCGDNAAMIGAMGYFAYQAGVRAPLSQNATATCKITEKYIM